MQATNFSFTPAHNTTYKMVSVLDGNLALSVIPGTLLRLYTFTGAESQAFRFQLQSNGKYSIYTNTKSFTLHVKGNSTADFAALDLQEGNGPSSFFNIVPVTIGQWAGKAYYIHTFANGKTIEIPNEVANGREIVQSQFKETSNKQKWMIMPNTELSLVDKEFIPFPNTEYRIVTILDQSKSLTVIPGQRLMTLSDYIFVDYQRFKITMQKGKARFVIKSTNQNISIEGDSNYQMANIVAVNHESPSMWFSIVRNKAGTYAGKGYLLTTSPYITVDINHGSLQNGARIITYGIKQSGNQTWLLVPANWPLPEKQ